MLTPVRGFIGPSYISRNPQFDYTRTVNWYPSLDENQTGTNQQVTQALCTPGLTNVLANTLSQPGQTAIRGLYTATNGNCFFVSGDVLYMLQAGATAPYTPLVCGNLSSHRGRVRMADNGINLVLVDGPYGYSTDLNNPDGTFAQITDPAFQGATFVEFYDGYFIFNKPGTVIFYWSDPNAITFDALNFASKSGNADPIAGIAVLFRTLWLIGTYTTEQWYDIGGDNTFQRLSGPYVEQGCAAPDSIAKGETGIFWIAQSLRGGVTVVRTNNNALTKVSTLSVDFQLQQYGANIQRSTGLCYQQDGDLFYQVNPFNGTSSWVFDDTITTLLGYPPQWHERTHTIQPEESTPSLLNGTEERHLGDVSTYFNNQNIVGSWKAAKLYAFDTDNYTDDGGYITRTKTSPHINVNGNRVFYGLFRLGCQVGMGQLPSHICPQNTFSTLGAAQSPDGNAVGYNTFSVDTDSNVSLHITTEFSSCTYLGFSNTTAIPPGGFFGSVNNDVLFGNSLIQIATHYTDLGEFIDLFFISFQSQDPANPPPQNLFTQMTYTDNVGNVALFKTAQSDYSTSGANIALWTFTWPDDVIPWSPQAPPWAGANNPGHVDVVFTQTTVVIPPYGTMDPISIPGANVASIQNQYVDGSSNTILLCLQGTNNAPSQDVFPTLTFFDNDGNEENYTPINATFSQNTANSPPDSTWVWPSVTADPIFLDGQSYAIDFGGGGNCIDIPPPPTARLSWSDDGAYVWSAEIATSVGEHGEYKHLVEWWRLGEGRNRIFRIRFTDPIPFNLSWAAVDVQPTNN